MWTEHDFFYFSVLGPWRALYIFARGFMCEVLENLCSQAPRQSHNSDFLWWALMLFVIRRLRHSKTVGRNKLKNSSLKKQTTSKPMSLCVLNPSCWTIQWPVPTRQPFRNHICICELNMIFLVFCLRSLVRLVYFCQGVSVWSSWIFLLPSSSPIPQFWFPVMGTDAFCNQAFATQ